MTTLKHKVDPKSGATLFFVEPPRGEHGPFKSAGFWFFGSRTRDPRPASAGLPQCCWYTVERGIAARYASLADEETGALLSDAREALVASREAEGDFAIPVPAGLEYRPYQKAGVSAAVRAFERKRKGFIIADEMGLGKTMQAIGFMASERPETVLIVAPASVSGNWVREISKWLPHRASDINCPKTGTAPSKSAQIVVINYDRVVGDSPTAKATRAALERSCWDLVIFDEIHNLKNEETKRTRFFLGTWGREGQTKPGLINRATFVLALTGTPIPNRTREMVPLLRALGAFSEAADAVARSVGSFLYRYCDPVKTSHGTTFDGTSRHAELQDRLRAGGWMVRRQKSQVLTDLPPKIREVILLPEVPEVEEIRALEQALGLVPEAA